MSPDVHILLSGARSFGVPLAFAIRELIVLGREPGGPAGRDGDIARDPGPAPSPDDELVALPPLPPGLVLALRGDPEIAPAPRARVLEDA